MVVMSRATLPVLALSALAATSLAACGSGSSDAGSSDGKVAVTAAFYPLEYAAERVGGDHVDVSSLTKPGAEPHDVELTPQDVAGLGEADLVIYEKGFQPAVDDAVSQVDGAKALDVSATVDLSVPAADDGHDHAGEGHEHGGTDPHFWLDPTRYAKAVEAVAERLAQVDPAHATAYRENATAFVGELVSLDKDFASTLATCTSRDLVTGHAAFGYLADRYDLHQEGIAGLSPDAEPDAASITEMVAHIKEHGVRTVYAETLVSKDLTETVAREAGATVAVLDPIEGITDASAGKDYLEVMRANLATLKEGQGCR